MRNDLTRVKRLISERKDVNARMYAGHYKTWDATPLHLAAAHDAAAIINELIKAGADKDATDRLGFSPLHRALFEGADEAAQALVRSGASVHVSAQSGQRGYALQNAGPPIRAALERASIETVQSMLAAGGDPASEIGPDAMGWADSPDLLPKLRLLLDLGFSVNGEGRGSSQPLHAAASNNDVAAIEFLVAHGANLEDRGGSESLTPLLLAAYVGADDAIKALIAHGANPKAGTDYFGSPMYAAAFSGKTETVRLLLSMNLEIDLQAGRASDKATPLHFAYWNADDEMARMLIEAGANPNARTTDGRLPAEFRKQH